MQAKEGVWSSGNNFVGWVHSLLTSLYGFWGWNLCYRACETSSITCWALLCTQVMPLKQLRLQQKHSNDCPTRTKISNLYEGLQGPPYSHLLFLWPCTHHCLSHTDLCPYSPTWCCCDTPDAPLPLQPVWEEPFLDICTPPLSYSSPSSFKPHLVPEVRAAHSNSNSCSHFSILLIMPHLDNLGCCFHCISLENCTSDCSLEDFQTEESTILPACRIISTKDSSRPTVKWRCPLHFKRGPKPHLLFPGQVIRW